MHLHMRAMHTNRTSCTRTSHCAHHNRNINIIIIFIIISKSERLHANSTWMNKRPWLTRIQWSLRVYTHHYWSYYFYCAWDTYVSVIPEDKYPHFSLSVTLYLNSSKKWPSLKNKYWRDTLVWRTRMWILYLHAIYGILCTNGPVYLWSSWSLIMFRFELTIKIPEVTTLFSPLSILT